MPQLRGVTVHVVDGDGNDLQEWGVRTLGSSKTAVSAFIQSTTDMPFRVSVRPQIPYIDEQQRSEGGSLRKTHRNLDEVYVKEEEGEDEDMDRTALHSRSRAHDRYTYSHTSRRRRSTDGEQHRHSRDRKRSSDRHPASSSLYRRKTSYDAVPPFHLLATLYLDGRAKAERRSVVYLDPSEDDFSHPDGKVTFKNRCVQGRDGRLKEQAWVFKDIGIETVFKRIALSGDAKDLEDPDDLLVDAMSTSKLAEEDPEATQEQGKVGQILVVLKRVRLGRRFLEYNRSAKHHEGDEGDIDMDEIGQDVAHHTAFQDLRTLEPQATRCIEFDEYKNGEPPWATFQFFYRSQEQLKKFGFSGFPQTSRAEKNLSRGGRRWDTNLAMLTPLSIANPKKTPKTKKRSKDTFEERVRQGKGDFEPSKYDFRDHRGAPDDIPTTTYGEGSSHGKTRATSRRADGVDKEHDNHSRDKGVLSTVVAVKERGRRPLQAVFTTGASRSGSPSPAPGDSSADPPLAPGVEAPANSPTTGFYDPLSDPRLTAPKGSALDTFKTLSDASLKLTETGESAKKGQLTPKYNVKDAAYRQLDYGSDADDEKDGLEDTDPSELDDDEGGPSDKENMPLHDGDDSGLHEKFHAVSLGAKRQRGEGTEGPEEDEAEARQLRKLTSPTKDVGPAVAGVEQALELLIEEGKQGTAIEQGKQQAKRFKA